jgi:hypothetical protein
MDRLQCIVDDGENKNMGPRIIAKRPAWAAVLTASLCLGAAGCVAIQGYPETSYNPKEELNGLAQYYGPDVTRDYDNEPAADKRKALRDKILNGRIRATDIHFIEFQKAFYSEALIGSIGTDIGVLALNATAAVTGSASTKAALSAASGAIVGSKASIDKNVYFEKTISVLISRMVAERKKILARVREQMSLPDESYSLHQGLVEVEDYYFAGTIPGGIQQISNDAGKVSNEADQRIDKTLSARTTAFVEEGLQQRIESLLSAVDAIPAANDAAIIAIATAPPSTTDEIESIVAARDPRNLRSTDANVARQITKMRITLMDRQPEQIERWSATLKSAALPK